MVRKKIKVAALQAFHPPLKEAAVRTILLLKDESVQSEQPIMQDACVLFKLNLWNDILASIRKFILEIPIKKFKRKYNSSKKEKQCKEAALKPGKLLEELTNKRKIKRVDEIAKFIKNSSPS
ncbi:unnamed protein product [Meloidogyne enterolobii]|uniref:Uncharacterized protein n=1 Tax=Meloidogyne enterolobii TaxID=390850 RepID=A0ACB1A5E7_MELEN